MQITRSTSNKINRESLCFQMFHEIPGRHTIPMQLLQNPKIGPPELLGHSLYKYLQVVNVIKKAVISVVVHLNVGLVELLLPISNQIINQSVSLLIQELIIFDFSFRYL